MAVIDTLDEMSLVRSVRIPDWGAWLLSLRSPTILRQALDRSWRRMVGFGATFDIIAVWLRYHIPDSWIHGRKDSRACCVYYGDVITRPDLKSNRQFTRSWTLQELDDNPLQSLELGSPSYQYLLNRCSVDHKLRTEPNCMDEIRQRLNRHHRKPEKSTLAINSSGHRNDLNNQSLCCNQNNYVEYNAAAQYALSLLLLT
jgi:hypothetical protein